MQRKKKTKNFVFYATRVVDNARQIDDNERYCPSQRVTRVSIRQATIECVVLCGFVFDEPTKRKRKIFTTFFCCGFFASVVCCCSLFRTTRMLTTKFSSSLSLIKKNLRQNETLGDKTKNSPEWRSARRPRQHSKKNRVPKSNVKRNPRPPFQEPSIAIARITRREQKNRYAWGLKLDQITRKKKSSQPSWNSWVVGFVCGCTFPFVVIVRVCGFVWVVVVIVVEFFTLLRKPTRSVFD